MLFFTCWLAINYVYSWLSSQKIEFSNLSFTLSHSTVEVRDVDRLAKYTLKYKNGSHCLDCIIIVIALVDLL